MPPTTTIPSRRLRETFPDEIPGSGHSLSDAAAGQSGQGKGGVKDHGTPLSERAGRKSLRIHPGPENRDDRKHRARKLSELLRRYEERLELRERRETLETLAKYEEANSASLEMLAFQTDLTGRQKRQIERRLERLGEVSEEEALSLLDDDLEELKKYLYYTSARYIKKLDSPQNRDLLEIIQMEDEKSGWRPSGSI